MIYKITYFASYLFTALLDGLWLLFSRVYHQL